MGGKSPRLPYTGVRRRRRTATGLPLRRHIKEQAALIDAALTLAS